MSLFWRLVLGLVVMAVGFHMVWKTLLYQEWTGVIEFAEEKLGSGGTNTFLKLIGAGVCFIGVAIATNLISDILNSFAGLFVAG
ncbi:MAG: hypothetical protein WC702_03110 [Patescibacteria group bacterium]